MKKFSVLFLAIICSVLFIACSSEQASNLTLEDVIVVFESELNQDIDRDERPIFQMIGATDGVIFYNDLSPVKLYEFASDKAYKEAVEEFAIITDWPRKGNIVIETYDTEALAIFDSIKE